MKILLVEDDHLQVQWIKEGLLRSFPSATIEVISTELGFRSKLPELAEDIPAIVIMDVMLRWTDPTPDLQTPPEEVKKEGFFRAGLRCARLLSEQPSTRDIPVILYSVLERSDIATDLKNEPNVHHLRKDSAYEPLARRIQELLVKQSPAGIETQRHLID